MELTEKNKKTVLEKFQEEFDPRYPICSILTRIINIDIFSKEIITLGLKESFPEAYKIVREEGNSIAIDKGLEDWKYYDDLFTQSVKTRQLRKKVYKLIMKLKNNYMEKEQVYDEDKVRLRKDLQDVINKHDLESGSNTSDLVLAEYLTDCLLAFDNAVNKREEHENKK